MYISWAPCQVEGSQSIVLASNVYILGALSGGKVPEYINGFLCIILGLMSGQKVPEDRNGFLCIYTVPFVRWEGSRI